MNRENCIVNNVEWKIPNDNIARTVIWRKRSTPVISKHRYLVNKGYRFYKVRSQSVYVAYIPEVVKLLDWPADVA